jgi:predicted HTH domain antitoxin
MNRYLRDVARSARLAREYAQGRDLAIRIASENGFSLREIAEVAGLSHAGVAKILARHG